MYLPILKHVGLRMTRYLSAAPFSPGSSGPACPPAPKVTRPVSQVSRLSTTTAGGRCFDFLDAGAWRPARKGLERRGRSSAPWSVCRPVSYKSMPAEGSDLRHYPTFCQKSMTLGGAAIRVARADVGAEHIGILTIQFRNQLISSKPSGSQRDPGPGSLRPWKRFAVRIIFGPRGGCIAWTGPIIAVGPCFQ